MTESQEVTAMPLTAIVKPPRALQRLADAAVRKGLLDATSIAGSGTVPSPCVSVCKMSDSVAQATSTRPLPGEPVCLGCLRTLPEIMEWSRAVPERKLAIWQLVMARMQAGLALPVQDASMPAP